MRAALAVVAVLAPAIAAAEPPGLVIPTPMQKPTFVDAPDQIPVDGTESYRWQTLGVDAMAVAAIFAAEQEHDGDWAVLGLGMYVVAAPIVHAGNGHGGRAIASLALRVGLPLAFGVAADQLLGPGVICETSVPGGGGCEPPPVSPTFAVGAAIGMVGAMLLDSAVIARPTKVRRWAPTAGATRDTVAVGLSGAF